MFADWIWTSWEQAGLVVLSALVMLSAVIAAFRLFGLRSLSKMSSFDFAVTVAIGSILAGAVATSTPLANGVLAVASLLALQAAIAFGRRRFSLAGIVDNDPVFLMIEGSYIEDALSSSRVTEADVVAKLREANVLALSDVRAVVLETTGDISVLHGDGPVDDALLGGIRDLRHGGRP